MTEQLQVSKIDLDRREGEIHTRIAELRRDATDALLRGDNDSHSRIAREIVDQEKALGLVEDARAEHGSREAVRALDQADELAPRRAAAAAAIDTAAQSFVAALEAWHAIASEHAGLLLTGLAATELPDVERGPVVSDARAASHRVLGALTHAARGRDLGEALAWLPNAHDPVPAADSDFQRPSAADGPEASRA